MAILIDANALCEYANNLKDKQIDANDIMRFPRVDAEPVRHGRWISTWRGYWHSCSICGGVAIPHPNGEDILPPYCPWCGARMDGGIK